MDEFSVPAPTTGANIPKSQMPPAAPFRNDNIHNILQERLHDYLEKELKIVVQDKKEEMNLELDESYTNFIKRIFESSCLVEFNIIFKRSPRKIEIYHKNKWNKRCFTELC